MKQKIVVLLIGLLVVGQSAWAVKDFCEVTPPLPDRSNRSLCEGIREFPGKVLFSLFELLLPDLPDRNGRIPLNIAAAEGRLVWAWLLVKAGARVNDKDAHGYGSLDAAQAGESLVTAQLLRWYGAQSGAEIQAEEKLKGLRFRARL